MTRDALRELLKVSGENLAFIPNTEKLREYLAQLVLDRYQQLGDRFPTDPGVQLETAQVFRVHRRDRTHHRSIREIASIL